MTGVGVERNGVVEHFLGLRLRVNEVVVVEDVAVVVVVVVVHAAIVVVGVSPATEGRGSRARTEGIKNVQNILY